MSQMFVCEVAQIRLGRLNSIARKLRTGRSQISTSVTSGTDIAARFMRLPGEIAAQTKPKKTCDQNKILEIRENAYFRRDPSDHQ